MTDKNTGIKSDDFYIRSKWKWNRYRDGLFIPTRKRIYLYWFKFLQEAEKSPDHKVDWKEYRGWGGSNVILGQKFDYWWEERWKDLFGSKDGSSKAKVKFPITTTQPKARAMKIALLVWLHRNTSPDYTPKSYGGTEARSYSRRGGRNLAIARKIVSSERYKGDLSDIDPSQVADEQILQSKIGRYKRQAIKMLDNVCEGKFP